MSATRAGPILIRRFLIDVALTKTIPIASPKHRCLLPITVRDIAYLLH